VRPGKQGKKRSELTTPDLVLLSLLAERPMHGYQANLELERRCIRDWADISRPQVYYSLEKLARLGMISPARSASAGLGPERRVFATSAKGRAALADALEREEWAVQRERPRFLTWIALSWQTRRGVFERQLRRRRRFLESEILREKATLRAVLREVGHPHHEAVWMITQMIAQFRLESRWLERLAQELPRRARALHPSVVPAEPQPRKRS
jgi:DNA-binding PadR family transcriptional regulator